MIRERHRILLVALHSPDDESDVAVSRHMTLTQHALRCVSLPDRTEFLNRASVTCDLSPLQQLSVSK